MSYDAAKTTISRAFAAVVILGVLVVLAGLAYASPPDASSIPGVYDRAGLDDVVAFVTGASGVVGPWDLAGLPVFPPRTAPVALCSEKTPVSACPAPLRERAPPLA